MRQIQSITKELAKLLDRRAELIEQSAPGTVETETRRLIAEGAAPREAVARAQEGQAERIRDDIELEAVEDRIVEVFNELRERLAPEREKRVANAEAKLKSDLLKWMAGDGVKLFPNEQVRERVFIFSNAADAACEHLEKAVSLPTLSTRDFQWQAWTVRRPDRWALSNANEAVTHPRIEQSDSGRGIEHLPRLLEKLG